MASRLLVLAVLLGVAYAATTTGTCGAGNAMSIGRCISGKAGPCGSGLSIWPGYACDSTLKYCCPTADVTNRKNWVGPSFGGKCPPGSTVVYGMPEDTTKSGMCIVYEKWAGPAIGGVCPPGFVIDSKNTANCIPAQ